MEQLFSWGKLKTSGDNQMYPVQDQNMTGVASAHRTCGAREMQQCCKRTSDFEDVAAVPL